MQRDPICGMTGVIERHGQWFCSEHCVAEYQRRSRHLSARQRRAGDAPNGVCGLPMAGRRQVVGDPWVWVPLSGLLLATAGSWWPAAAASSAIYIGYVRKVLAPLALGLLLGGMIDHFIPREYIIKLLSGSRKRVIVRATLLGFLASACSHGCLALTIELYRKGASTSAAVSFLLASPWASMALTLLLLSLFGVKGILIVAGALTIALLTGFIFQRLEHAGLVESNPITVTLPVEPRGHAPDTSRPTLHMGRHPARAHDGPSAAMAVAPGGMERFSIRQDLASRWQRYPWTAHQMFSDLQGVIAGMIPLGRMVLGWVQLGLMLSAILGACVPHGTFVRFLGPSVGGLLLTLAAAAAIEVCSEGTAPLAFELYRHTGAFGNAFAFLMGGVVADYTELGALWTAIGKRTVLWILLITLPMVIGLGLLLNLARVH